MNTHWCFTAHADIVLFFQERLHTVLEETEEQLPYRSLPSSLNSFHGSLKTPSRTNSLPRQYYPSENHQPVANPVAAPVTCFSYPFPPPSTSVPRKDETPHYPTLEWVNEDLKTSTHHSLPVRTEFYDPHSSLNRALNSYSFQGEPIHDRFSQQVSLKPSTAEQDWNSRQNFEQVSSNVWNNPWNGGEPSGIEPWSSGDLLESELEFSSLLPGSRKTVAPSTNGRPSVVSLKPPPRIENDQNSHIKYMNIPGKFFFES